MTQCCRIVEGGLQCGAEAQRDSRLCFLYDTRPEVVHRAQRARSRGGKAAHAPLDPSGVTVDVSSAEAILTSLKGVAQAVLDGRLDRARAGGAVYALQAAVAARKYLAHETRLRRIEKRLRLNENPLENDDEEAEDAEPN
jgi:hypothetical protein